MPALILFQKRTIIGGDDIQPTMIISIISRILQILLLCIPILHYTILHILQYIKEHPNQQNNNTNSTFITTITSMIDDDDDTHFIQQQQYHPEKRILSLATTLFSVATTTTTIDYSNDYYLSYNSNNHNDNNSLLQQQQDDDTTTNNEQQQQHVQQLQHSMYLFYIYITIWCTCTVVYNIVLCIFERYIILYSNIGTPTTQIIERSYKIQYIVYIKLVPCTIILFMILLLPIVSIIWYYIIPHYQYYYYYNHHQNHQNQYYSDCNKVLYDDEMSITRTTRTTTSASTTTTLVDNTFSNTITDDPIRTSLWWIAIIVLFIAQLIEFIVSILFSYQLYQLPSIHTTTTTSDFEEEVGSFTAVYQQQHHNQQPYYSSSSRNSNNNNNNYTYNTNYNHELVEEMWAKRCVSICRCLSISTCYMFGGRNLLLLHNNNHNHNNNTTRGGVGGDGRGDVLSSLSYTPGIGIGHTNVNTNIPSSSTSTTTQASIFVDVARALADFLESRGVLNIVLSDIVTGLILLQRIQRQRIYHARQQYYNYYSINNNNNNTQNDDTFDGSTIRNENQGIMDSTGTNAAFRNHYHDDMNNDTTIITNMTIDRVESGILDTHPILLNNNTTTTKDETVLHITSSPNILIQSASSSVVTNNATNDTTMTIRKRSSSSKNLGGSGIMISEEHQLHNDDTGGLLPVAATSNHSTSSSSSRSRTKSVDRLLVQLPSMDDISSMKATTTTCTMSRSLHRHKNSEYDAVLQHPYNHLSMHNTNDQQRQQQQQNEMQSHSYYRINTNGMKGYHREDRAILNRYDYTELYLLEEAARYAKYALAIYTWILYLYEHPVTGPFRLLLRNRSNICCCCCSNQSQYSTTISTSPSSSPSEQQQRHYALDEPLSSTSSFVTNTDEFGRFEGDTMCHAHKNAILLTAGLQEADIVYIQLRNSLTDIPYCILLDHAWKSVVVSIRGTFSIEDCINDVLITPESLEQLGLEFGFDAMDEYCHGGVMSCARNVHRDLERHGILDKLLLGEDAKFPGYTLRLVGHSLGAATCTLLAYMLKQKFSNLRCINYSPPGCSFTWKMATQCKDWCTTCVLDSDLVPRLTVESIERLRDEVLELIGRIKVPKSVVAQRFTESTFRICNEDYDKDGVFNDDFSDILYDPDDVPDTEYKQQLILFKEIQDERRRHRGTVRSTPLYPPGRILHLVKTGEERSCVAGLAKVVTCCTTNMGSKYLPVWVNNDDFNEIVVGPRMGTDHFPNRIRAILEKVAASMGQ